MTISIASSITKAASKQTYYTIRFLVDRDRDRRRLSGVWIFPLGGRYS